MSHRGRLRAGDTRTVGQVLRARQRGEISSRLCPVSSDHRGPDVHTADGERQQHRHHGDRHQAGRALLSVDQVRPQRSPPLRW